MPFFRFPRLSLVSLLFSLAFSAWADNGELPRLLSETHSPTKKMTPLQAVSSSLQESGKAAKGVLATPKETDAPLSPARHAGDTTDQQDDVVIFLATSLHAGSTDAQDCQTPYNNRSATPEAQQKFDEWAVKAAENGHLKAQTILGITQLYGSGSVARNETEGLKWLTKAAQAGDPEAQFALYRVYSPYTSSCGLELAKDEQKALYWLTSAARQNHPDAQFQLGAWKLMHVQNESDIHEILKWFEKAALQDHPATWYLMGLVVGYDDPSLREVALLAFRRAAELGHADAQIRYGLALMNGKGVAQDQRQGFTWLEKAARQGSARGQYYLGSAYYNGRGTPKDIHQAAYWIEKSAAGDDAYGQLGLGFMYASGKGKPKNEQEALRWFDKSARQGYTEAQYALGLLYLKGIDTGRNPVKGAALVEQAALKDFGPAQYTLGYCYEKGDGVARDWSKAIDWYRKAFRHGETEAALRLGNMYYKGMGVPVDRRKAAEWIRTAAEQGNAIGQYILGRLYLEGKGVPKNDKKAIAWLEKAARQDYLLAQKMLAGLYLHAKNKTYSGPYHFDKNVPRARYWLEKTVAKGDTDSEVVLAFMLMDGYHTRPDIKRAKKLIDKAISKGNTLAVLLSGFYYEKFAPHPDKKRAVAAYRQAAAAGEPIAVERLRQLGLPVKLKK